MSSDDRLPDWPGALRRYLGASIAAHLVWETLQLPLYTLWADGTRAQQAFAVLHCAAGDIVIALVSLALALALFARRGWPTTDTARVYWTSLVCCVGYTIFSEWLNTGVRASWNYSDFMPVVPVIRTGLAPLMQWLVVPTFAQRIALGRAPWNSS